MHAIETEATVLAVEEHPLPCYSLILRTPPELASTRAGQFVMLQVGERLEPYLRRAFSVHDVSKEAGWSRMELLAKVVGRGTRLLAESRPGDRLPLLGPLGQPFGMPPEAPVALVAGGVGSAVLFLLARALAERELPFDLFYGARSAVDLARRQVFEALAGEVGGRLIATTEDGSAGEKGLVTEPLERGLAAGDYRFLYACGPMPLLARVAALGAQYGVPGQAALETPMGCGYGACLGCAVPHVSGHYALCCKDGAVFALDEVAW